MRNPAATPFVMLNVNGISAIVRSAGIPIPGSDHSISRTRTIM
jgi:hypothetical protein